MTRKPNFGEKFILEVGKVLEELRNVPATATKKE
jgi:hypothetical protein